MAAIFVAKEEEKAEDGELKQTKCTKDAIHIATEINGHFNPTSPPHSPPKLCFDDFSSHFHCHQIDTTGCQRLQPHQSAAMLQLCLQSLHQLVFHVVDLAKRVPGFQLMTQHDQLHIIKRQFSTTSSSSSSSLVVVVYGGVQNRHLNLHLTKHHLSLSSS